MAASFMWRSAPNSNIAENGLEEEAGRACIYELDLVTEKQPRICPGGLRNPVGMAWEPTNGPAVDSGQ